MRISFRTLACVGVTAALPLSAWLAPSIGYAMGEEPKKPAIDCTQQKNKNKAECKDKKASLSDDELYYAGYWLARAGKYDQALTYLRRAQNPNDPRILNYIGFSTRKLGRVDEAMTYYRKVLELAPDYTLARAYLGEAFLQKGETAKAVEQLGEIEKRCGKACAEYAELAQQIERFEQGGAGKG